MEYQKCAKVLNENIKPPLVHLDVVAEAGPPAAHIALRREAHTSVRTARTHGE
jgi:hypothetical protein